MGSNLNHSSFKKYYLLFSLLIFLCSLFYAGSVELFEEPLMRFAIISDTHFGKAGKIPDISEKILDKISESQDNFDVLFHTGDMVDMGFLEFQWKQALEAINSRISLPVYYVMGNHEALGNGKSLFSRYILGEENSMENVRSWRREDFGKVHFYILEVLWNSQDFTKEQEEWLINELKNTPSEDWKIVMLHCIIFSSGGKINGFPFYDMPDLIEKLVPILEENHVDLVFSGHVHIMELLKSKDIYYIVCGTGGGGLDKTISYESPASLWRNSSEYGFVEVDLYEKSFSIRFKNEKGLILYEFKSEKN